MTDLPYRIIYKPHSPTEQVAFVSDADGRLRRATPAEEAFWLALEAANARLAELEQPDRAERGRARR